MRAGDIDFVSRAPMAADPRVPFGRRSSSESGWASAPSFNSSHPALSATEFDHGLPLERAPRKPPSRQRQPLPQQQPPPLPPQQQQQRRSMAPIIGGAPSSSFQQQHPDHRPHWGGSSGTPEQPPGQQGVPHATRRKPSGGRRGGGAAAPVAVPAAPDASVGMLITAPMSIGMQQKPQREPRKPVSGGSLNACGKAGELSAPPGSYGMERASVWSEAVEDVFRLQEAGYRDLGEMLELGEPQPERFPNGFVKKLRSKTSVGSGAPSYIYFSSKRECAESELNRVKIYYVKE